MQQVPTQRLRPSVTVEIVEAIAAREGVDETTLPPLGDVIDPDALNALFAPSAVRGPDQPAFVQFRYCGYTVAVAADRTITVR